MNLDSEVMQVYVIFLLYLYGCCLCISSGLEIIGMFPFDINETLKLYINFFGITLILIVASQLYIQSFHVDYIGELITYIACTIVGVILTEPVANLWG